MRTSRGTTFSSTPFAWILSVIASIDKKRYLARLLTTHAVMKADVGISTSTYLVFYKARPT